MSNRAVKFITCGHVDDGKSTLLGRLLYEMGVLPDDQIAGATENGVLDYSRLTDGLEDERAQGITIDVAYRYVRHGDRRYRFADTPGHLQYLRNMAVAAPDGDVAILLVDASHGVRDQTIRHGKIAAFFGIKDFVLAINKMDKINYNEKKYHDILSSFQEEMKSFENLNITAIPLSAIDGANVIKHSDKTQWYQGKTLLDYISEYTPKDVEGNQAMLAVQNVVRITDTKRGYQGTLRGGSLKIGDILLTADTPQKMTVKEIIHSGHSVDHAIPGNSITVVIDIDIDLSRGTVLAAENSDCLNSDYMEGGLVILDNRFDDMDTLTGLLKNGHKEVSAQIDIKRKDGPIAFGEIFTSHSLSYKGFHDIPELGLFILIEKGTEKVIAVGQFFGTGAKRGAMYMI